jgi:hypothetical protein
MQVWGIQASLHDLRNLAGLFAAMLAVKVFLNSAVGIIGKLALVLWVDSTVWPRKPFFSI